MSQDKNQLTNEFYRQAINSQAIVERYRYFVTRSLPAMMGSLPGYDENMGKAIFEEITKNIEGDTDLDILKRELCKINKGDGNQLGEK